MSEQGEEAMKVPQQVPRDLVAAGHLGRTTGRGRYAW
jgi:3-hydroxyacyl-CoA dehydrogenase